jgi:23S rRNA pseudouridine2604 synthase
MTDPIRLSKRVAALAGCSRGQAEQYIEGGWVRVDGEVVEQPQFKVGDQQVEIDPGAKLQVAEPATVLWHKPGAVALAGADDPAWQTLITTANHWSEDASGVRPLKRHLLRLTPMMPLDRDAEGLQVLTQDGRVWRRLSEDADTIEQEYVIDFAGELPADALERLNAGAPIWGQRAQPCKASRQSDTLLRVVLKGVRPGQLHEMCRAVGIQPLAIRRLRIGKVSLGKMPPGMWRYQPVTERF